MNVDHGPDTELKLPDPEEKFEGLELYGTEDLESSFFGKNTTTLIYFLRAFKPGKYYIPPLTVEYRRGQDRAWEQIETEDMKLRIIPVVGFDPAKELLRRVNIVTDSRIKEVAVTGQRETSMDIDMPIRFPIRDIKGPMRVHTPRDFLFTGLMLFGSAVVLVVILSIVATIILAAVQVKKPPLSARYVKELKDLRNKQLIKKGEQERFSEKLYSVITSYIKERSGIPDREMTTREFLGFIKDLKDLDNRHKEFIREKLLLCDLVKYSGYRPSAEELDPELKEEMHMILELDKKGKEEASA
ncbi:MAG: hypothetical protein GF392_02015 [Candidatus Omnitrophica bacterium]|nr:hypothetical protein [Candidatus Omnitrophota bacterium]